VPSQLGAQRVIVSFRRMDDHFIDEGPSGLKGFRILAGAKAP
jgi:uncharacterized circularly permuted ATP-grasp superfamily protein